MNEIAKTLFSFVVPIYNVELFLEKCVDSIINQTFGNFEVILVDDGSTDSSAAICDKYQKQDTRISVIHKENGGLSDARNIGLQKATGKYVIFVDSDDYITLDACEKLTIYSQSDIDIIVCRGMSVGPQCALTHSQKNIGKVMTGSEFLLEEISNGSMPMAVCLNVYRRKFLVDNMLQFKFGIYHEDEQFTPRAFLRASRVIDSNIDLYRYIIRTDSITTRKDKRKNLDDLYGSLIELKEIYSRLADKELKTELYDSLASKYLSLFYDAKGYQYGKNYYHKVFILSCARKLTTFSKALLYFVSPRIYWWTNRTTKIFKSILQK